MDTSIISKKALVLFCALAVGTSTLAGCGASADVSADDGAETEGAASSRAAKFEVFRGAQKQYYFHLIAANGQNVLRSEAYTTKQAAQSGVASVVANGNASANYKILEARDGSFYFNVKAANGETIATSETYSTKSNAQRAVKTSKRLIGLAAGKAVATAARGAKFENFAGEDGQSYFRVRAGNGEIILTSEGYTSTQGRDVGLAAVKREGQSSANFEVFEAQNGQYGLRLKAANHEIIARGELYSSKSNADRASARIQDLLVRAAAAGGVGNGTIDLAGQIKSALFGMSYMSETDSDYYYLSAPDSGVGTISPATVVTLLGPEHDRLAAGGAPGADDQFRLQGAGSQVVSADDFLSGIAEAGDPNDADSVAQARKGKALKTLLDANLTNMTAIRFFNGTDPNDPGSVSYIIVGRTRDGQIVGFLTFAAET